MPSKSPIGQTHYVAALEDTPVAAVDRLDESQKARSTWADAWDAMRRRPAFWISSVLILLIVVVALLPGLFTSVDPLACALANSNGGPAAGHLLGFNRQGCDVYARIIHGAQASVTVGLLATSLVTLFGLIVGALAGFYGGFLDSVVSRVGDIFFAIPTVLGAIVLMSVLPERTPATVAFVLAVFAWPQIARITRGAVLSAKNSDYVTASVALGVSNFKILIRHVIPNSLAPVIVIATVSLGTFIVAEATLSFLGIGLPSDDHVVGRRHRPGADLHPHEPADPALPSDGPVAHRAGLPHARRRSPRRTRPGCEGPTMTQLANEEDVSQTLPTLPATTVSESREPLLQIRDLEVGFQTQHGLVPAVRGVSLTLHEGQTLAIVGESGSGKTTTAQSIINLLAGTGKVTAGEILFQGRDLTKLSAKEIQDVRGRLIGYVPQDPMSNLNPVWNIGFQVEEAIKANNVAQGKEARKRTIEVLEEAGLSRRR